MEREKETAKEKLQKNLIMPKMSGYVKTFKVKEGDKDKNNKLMSFRIDYEKLLEKCKAI